MQFHDPNPKIYQFLEKKSTEDKYHLPFFITIFFIDFVLASSLHLLHRLIVFCVWNLSISQKATLKLYILQYILTGIKK